MTIVPNITFTLNAFNLRSSLNENEDAFSRLGDNLLLHARNFRLKLKYTRTRAQIIQTDVSENGACSRQNSLCYAKLGRTELAIFIHTPKPVVDELKRAGVLHRSLVFIRLLQRELKTNENRVNESGKLMTNPESCYL